MAMNMLRSTVTWTMRSAVSVASVPGRLLGLLDSAESIASRADELVRRTTALLDDAERVTAAASALLADATRVTGDATGIVSVAGRTARTVDELVTSYQPIAKHFIEELSQQEVDAAVRMIDELPKLAEHLKLDVLPILATLDRVGPDIHDLLEVTNDVRQAILGIPGFGFLRKRGEEKDEDEDVEHSPDTSS